MPKVRGPGPRPGLPKKTQHIVLAHVLLLLTFLVYLGSLNNEFVWRDQEAIVTNRWVRALGESHSFFSPSFWREEMHGVMPGYRPVVLLSYAADFFIWRNDALGFHLTNLFIHAFSALAVFFIVRRLVGDDGLAFLGGVLFAFHPISTEAVCYLSERATLMSWSFILLAWLAWWRSWKPASPGESSRRVGAWYTLALIMQGLAFGAGEVAWVLPLLQVASLSAEPEGFKLRDRKLAGILPFTLLGVAALLLHGLRAFSQIAGGSASWSVGSIVVKLAGAVGTAFRLVLFPVHLVAGRPIPEGASLLVGIFVVLAVGAFIVLSRRRLKRTSFGLLVLAISLLPVLLVVLVNGEARGEHLLYGSSAAYALVLVSLIYEASLGSTEGLLASRAGRRLALAVLVTVGLTFTASTAKRHLDWENDMRITQATLKARPDDVSLRAHMGGLLLKSGEIERAEVVLNGLKKGAPGAAETFSLEGEIALAQGYPREAARAFRKASSIRPGTPSALDLEVRALLEAGELDRAEGLLEESLGEHRGYPALVFARALISERRGRTQEALEGYRSAADLAPGFADYHLAHGLSAKALGRSDEAEGAFRAALRENPGFFKAYEALGTLMLEQGRSREVVILLASVVRWHPEEMGLALVLAEAWSREGHLDQARSIYERLTREHPEDARVQRAAAAFRQEHKSR